MIAMEVRLNGKRMCTAGAEDLTVLTTLVTALGKLGKKTVPSGPNDTTGEIHYSVGGLTGRKNSRKDVHLRWKSVMPLRIGDVIQVRVVETDKVDRPRSRTSAARKKA